MSTGPAMAFMIAGGVSSILAMAAVWSIVKRGVFVAYLALGLTGAILSGVVLQMFSWSRSRFDGIGTRHA
jgi:uncharacterized membrane protein YraQ (UPF0718 family)